MSKTINANPIYLYFDYKEVNGITLGAAIYAKETSAIELEKKVVTIEKEEGTNNYHHTFRALITALQLLDEVKLAYPHNPVVLMNQNERLFAWLQKGVSNPDYSDLLDEVDKYLLKFDLSRFSNKIIEGKHNRVKKILNAIKVKPAEQSMDFQRLQKNNVLTFRRLG